jgi:hypothetical protein
MILYKHGVGYFERRGEVTGNLLRFTFPHTAMDDVLKSLVAIDFGEGRILGLDFETPEDQEDLLAKGRITPSETHTILDLLRDIRGRKVRCAVQHQAKPPEMIEGLVIGVDHGNEDDPLNHSMLSLYQSRDRAVRTFPVNRLQRMELLEDSTAEDLSYFLRVIQSEEQRRHAVLHMTEGDHDVLIGYIAPAPAWRVSYRMLFDASEETNGSDTTGGAASDTPHSAQEGTVLLQGWGLFDNQLEEDLENVTLTLVAGMPISFRYRLYEPKTPHRPMVEDEERVVQKPVSYDAAPQSPARRAKAAGRSVEAFSFGPDAEEAPEALAAAAPMEMEDVEGSVDITTIGGERGSLFSYHVGDPVSVARGQSAMVPILGQRLSARRELLYNGKKLPKNPVASLRMTNTTGLTLERGPTTVMEEGDYAGEAVVPFTKDGSEVIVPYAVEIGITVEEERSQQEEIYQIAIQDEYMVLHKYRIVQTTYTLSSTLSKSAVVTIEYESMGSRYELVDTPNPDEEGASFKRWDVACEPHSVTRFQVKERRVEVSRERVQGMNGKRLHDYMKNRLLDENTVKELQRVLDIYHLIHHVNNEIKSIEKTRDNIYKKQKQIQGNLQPLATEGEESKLRQRYVQTLQETEDQLDELQQKEHRKQAEIAAHYDEIARILESLNTS